MAKSATETRASRPIRLDPYQAPHTFERGNTKIQLDHGGAVVKKTLSCGLPLSLAVPARAFKGVAARVVEHQDGAIAVSLELLHHDPALSITVLEADHMDDIAADWHSWSRLMKLPMLIIGEDEIAEPVRRQLGTLIVEAPWARRKRITAIKRRPNFLRRRKAGHVGRIEKISAEELIARR